MNQILSSTGNKNKKTKRRSESTLDLNTILYAFAVGIIVIGIALSGKAVYGFITTNKQSSTVAEANKPIIAVEQNDENGTIKITVTHSKEINKVVYQWNGEQENVIDGNGKTQIIEEISLPSGTNTLTINAIDSEGTTETKVQEFVSENAPIIKFDVVETSLKASIRSTVGIKTVTYKWDDGQETTKDVNDLSIEITEDIPQGEHTLYVTATDTDGAVTESKQTVMGVTKPKVSVTADGVNFIVDASASDQLVKAEVTVNGETKEVEINSKEWHITYPLISGLNKIVVKVYSLNDLTATFKGKANVVLGNGQ